MRKNILGLLASSLAMSDPDTLARMREFDENISKPSGKKMITTIIPKGTKEYFFREDGVFATEGTFPMRRDETVFWCYASNDKNAIRKFNAARKEHGLPEIKTCERKESE